MPQFPLNKGINKPVEFKGLVGKYLGYLAGGVGAVFMLALSLFFSGVNSYFVLALSGALGFGVITRVFTLNQKYGEHGAMKESAKRQQPRSIVNRDARLFRNLKQR